MLLIEFYSRSDDRKVEKYINWFSVDLKRSNYALCCHDFIPKKECNILRSFGDLKPVDIRSKTQKIYR